MIGANSSTTLVICEILWICSKKITRELLTRGSHTPEGSKPLECSHQTLICLACEIYISLVPWGTTINCDGDSSPLSISVLFVFFIIVQNFVHFFLLSFLFVRFESIYESFFLFPSL